MDRTLRKNSSEIIVKEGSDDENGEDESKILVNNQSKGLQLSRESTNDEAQDDESKLGYYTMDQLLTLAGDFGKIQWFCFAAILISNLSLSMYYYHFPYLELMPKFTCKIGNKIGACSHETVCSNQSIKQWKIDWSNEMSIHNWITDTEDYCIGSFRIGLIGSSYFAGLLIGSILLQSSDFIGRKRYFQIGSGLSIIVLYGLFYTDKMDTKLIFGPFLGMLYSIYLGSYAYLLEIVPKKSQSFMNYLFILSENVIPVLIGSSYFYLGGKEWTQPFSISLVLPIIGFLMLGYIPKSPQFLLDRGKPNEAVSELRKFAKYNGKELPAKFSIGSQSTNEDQQQNISKLKYKLLTSFKWIIKLVLVIMLFIHSNAQQVMWGFYVKHININIFLLSIIDSFTSTLMIVVTYFLLKYVPLKTLFISIILISFVLIIPMVVELPYEFLLWISYLGILAGLKSLSTISFLSISKMFTPALVPIVLTIANMLTNIAMVFAPMFAETPFPIPLIIFVGSSIVTLLLVIFIEIECT